MTKKQKKTELNKLLKSARIYDAIDQLESNLRLYQQAKNEYLIQFEILEIQQTIDKLKCQLQNLNEF